MYLYVEVWRAKPTWHALTDEERSSFAEVVVGLLGELVGPDLSLHGCVINEGEMARKADYEYVAIWQAASPSDIEKLEEGTDRIGWHEYFEQVNLGSEHVGPEAVIEHMVRSAASS